MEFYEFFSFLVILKESIKLLSKNGKLFSLIFILSLVLNSILFLSFNFSFKSLTNDMAVTLMNSFMPDPSSFSLDQSPFIPNNTSFMPDPSQLLAQGEHLREDFSLLLAVQMAFFIALFVISILSTTATVIVSAMSYNDDLILERSMFKDSDNMEKGTGNSFLYKTSSNRLLVLGCGIGCSFIDVC